MFFNLGNHGHSVLKRVVLEQEAVREDLKAPILVAKDAPVNLWLNMKTAMWNNAQVNPYTSNILILMLMNKKFCSQMLVYFWIQIV